MTNTSARRDQNLPLRYLPLHALWDIDTPQSRGAVEQRMHAFHEAGHVWAAHRSGLAPAVASRLSDGPAFLTNKAHTTVWVAAMGPYAQGVLVEADRARMEEGIPSHVPEVFFEGDQEDLDADTVRAHIATVGGPCCCRRGGDSIAASRLADLEWVERQLVVTMIDWTNIEALAHALLDGRTLRASEIDALVHTQSW